MSPRSTDSGWRSSLGSAYRIAPAPESSRSVLLLHGLGGNLDQLWDTIATREDQSATVIAMDARLHGQTSAVADEPLTFELLAQDALDLLTYLRPGDTYTLVGVSMGAGIALKMLQLAPGAFDRAVFIRPAWAHQPFPENLGVLTEVGRLLGELGAEAGKRAFAATESYSELFRLSPATASSAKAQFDAPLAAQRSRRLREMPADAPYGSPEDLQKIILPTLVIGAPGDPVHPVSLAKEWASGLPDSRFELVPSRDESPQRYQKGIRDLVDAFVSE